MLFVVCHILSVCVFFFNDAEVVDEKDYFVLIEGLQEFESHFLYYNKVFKIYLKSIFSQLEIFR